MKYIKAFLLVAFSVLAALCVFSACTEEKRPFATLQTPENVRVGSDEILTWDKVAAADGYEVSVDNVIYKTEGNNFDICLLTVDPYAHTIQVRATSNDENVVTSPFSEIVYYTAPTGSGIGAKLTSDGEGYMITALAELDKKTIIPEYFNGKPIIEIIGSAFENAKRLKAVYIPDSVKKIGTYAFSNCASLEYVRLPKELERIELCTFKDCSSLKTVEMPDKVTIIDNGAFENCVSLKTIKIPDSVEYLYRRAFANCISLENFDMPESLIGLYANVFDGCKAYKNLYIGKNTAYLLAKDSTDNLFEHITVDEENAVFYSKDDCVYKKEDDALVLTCKNSVLDSNVKKFGDYAFSGRKDLTGFVMPDAVEEIGNNCFADCTSLKTIKFSSALVTTGEKCFSNCTSLEKIEVAEANDKYYAENNCLIEHETKTLLQGCKNSVIPENVVNIGEYAFYKTDIKGVSVPSSVKKICDYAFCDNYNLEYVDLYSGLEYIGEDAFRYCYSIEYICIPKTVKHIGDKAFVSVYCSVTLPKETELEYIGETAFGGCTMYTDLPESEYRQWELKYGFPICVLGICEFIYEDESYYIKSIDIDNFYGPLPTIEIPGRKGYVFKGWSYEENGENQFTFFQHQRQSSTSALLDHGAKISYDANGNPIYLDGILNCCITKEEAQYLNENKKGATLYAIWEKE